MTLHILWLPSRRLLAEATGASLGLTVRHASGCLRLDRGYTWYNQRLADWLKQLKTTQDAFGGNLLDTTVIPYVTEVAHPNSSRSPKPALLFGGSKLGLNHGTFQHFSQTRPQVDLYLTCAQALLQTADPLSVLGSERFAGFNPAGVPIAGLWSAPA